ncbi:MAG TPA: FkbM family methyltransferase [Longimicrobiales bacterium]|nr:FkbM family methyltransferase [Longimicrobiales bacterium]
METGRHEEGLTLRLKRWLAVGELKMARRAFNAVAGHVPYRIKYAVGGRMRRRKHPYCLIRDGDTVVQVGAPRDLVHSGRSRAVHFARFVGSGVVIVMEPDPASARALEDYARRHGLGERMRIVSVGGWDKPTNLGFLSSDEHPAANIVEELEDRVAEDFQSRGYRRIVIPVDTVDNVVREAGESTPRLVSITTNGAEKEILRGMQDTMAAGCPYISLAVTGDDYVPHMRELGYELIAFDDRGFTFSRSVGAMVTSEPPAGGDSRA